VQSRGRARGVEAETPRLPDYDTLLAEVDSAHAFATLIAPDDPRFLAPDHMPDTINVCLREHGQQPLAAPPAFARCILESLVLRYSQVLRHLERLTDNPILAIHVLGGGSRNTRLSQWLADALGIPVVAGPTEATALGNALMQLVGPGQLHSLAEVRAIAQHAPTQPFTPRAGERARWEEAEQRFAALTAARVK
jgi:rhamnulokinase